MSVGAAASSQVRWSALGRHWCAVEHDASELLHAPNAATSATNVVSKAVASPPVDRHRRVELGERLGHARRAGDHAGLPGHEGGPGTWIAVFGTGVYVIAIGGTLLLTGALVLLRALPFPNPDRLVSVGKAATSEGLPGIGAYEYLSWSEKNTDFEDLAAFYSSQAGLVVRKIPYLVHSGKP